MIQKPFIAINNYANRNKILFAIIVFTTILTLGFFASKISFQENITALIPSNEKSELTSKVIQQLNFSDKITILIESKNNANSEDLSNFATQFLDKIDADCKPYIGKIQGKIDEENIQVTFDFVNKNLPFFLDKNDYKTIANKLQSDSISKIIEADYKNIISPTGIVSKDFILQDPLGLSFIALKKLQQLNIGADFELENGFIFTKDKKNLLLFITPKLEANETDKNTIFIDHLEKIKTNLNSKSEVATINYFGSTPVAVANATQIKKDVHLTSLFAMISLILVLCFFYRNFSTPILIFIPSLLGAVLAIAILYFLKGTISAISLGISSILLGETTDYSIYVLTHLRNKKDVKLLYKDISKPLMLCGITTAITFLCLFFIKSEALQDLGIFAALSVVSTSFFSLVFIPLLYKNTKVFAQTNTIDRIAKYNFHQNKYLIIGVLILIIGSLFTYKNAGFNNDISALNFMTPELKKTETKLENIANISSKSIYLASYGKNLEAVIENNNKLFSALENNKNNHQILQFSSIGQIVLSKENQQKKIQDWNEFWEQQNKNTVIKNIQNYGVKFGFKPDSFSVFYDKINQNFQPITFEEISKIKAFFVDEFVSEKNGFFTISSVVKVKNEQRDSFIKNIKKQQNLVVIDRQETNETFLKSLKINFEKLVKYSFIIIAIVLFLAFRRVELVIVSITPILLSWLFTTGIMGFFGIEFNVINIIVCTLIFGIGVDYSIFITMALQKEFTYGKPELSTYKSSILLSVITTILGIGVLVFAKHPALYSVALIAVIGIFSTLIVTFTIQPIVFYFFADYRTKKGLPPFEIKRLLHSSISFFYYGFGGFLLSIISWFSIKILPFPKHKKLQAFHYILSKFMHSVLKTYPSIKRKQINLEQEDFKKPAIIIANHSSFLDILAVGKLSPKIIFLVSDWVYNSPVFGKGVRLAGFYPVSGGIDNGIDHLKEKVNQGFSLMVFPEGTRSENNHINRFHKGAFYIAEELKLDIIPVVIHGYSEVLPKGDFIINGGKTTVEILPRIAFDDERFGKTYAEKTKKISVFFKSHYQKMRVENEDKDYFKKMIFNSFDYKEIKIIDAVKKDFDLQSETYYKLNKHLSETAKILHYANDYGQLDLLLTLQKPQRTIKSFVENETKRAVAKTNYLLKKRNICYLENYEIEENYDTVLISNVNFAINFNYINKANKIILIYSQIFKNQLIENGFEIEVEEKDIVVLNKKS